MGFHVALEGSCLTRAVEDDGELENTARYFRAAEVAELGFQVDEVGDKFLLRQLKSIIINEKRYGRENLVATQILTREEPTCTTSYSTDYAL